MTLTWTFSQYEGNELGGECTTDVCEQHPRLYRLRQRPNRDADYVTTYCVDGIVNHYASAEAALDAMRNNPQRH